LISYRSTSFILQNCITYLLEKAFQSTECLAYSVLKARHIYYTPKKWMGVFGLHTGNNGNLRTKAFQLSNSLFCCL